MSNTFKLICVSLTLASMALGLAACGDDNEPTTGTQPPTGSGETTTEIGIKAINGNPLTYNKAGQLISITLEGLGYGNITSNFSYDENTVTMTESGCSTVFEIGENGFATKATITYVGEPPYYCNFTYNSDGQMTSATYSNDVDGAYSTTIITYTNGDITAVITDDVENNYGYENNIENKGKIMFFDTIYGIDLDAMQAAYFAGILGNPTKHLPTSSNYSTYVWELNEDSLPTKFTSYYGNAEDNVLTFEW